MKRFKDKFCRRKECTVFLGDWGQTTRCKARFVVTVLCVDSSSKTKGFRKMSASHGYTPWFVNEFKTSQLCSGQDNDGASARGAGQRLWMRQPRYRAPSILIASWSITEEISAHGPLSRENGQSNHVA
jgi:hypothetical protein